MCCCCCCPPAIQALFCLWCQSGCSQASVAGALTFFPPEPALYKFERYDSNGVKLLKNEGENSESSDKKNGSREKKKQQKKRSLRKNSSSENSDRQEGALVEQGNSSEDEDDDLAVIELPQRSSSQQSSTSTTERDKDETDDRGIHVQAGDEGQTQEQMESPMEQLMKQAQERRVRAKARAITNARDAAEGVTYRFVLDTQRMGYGDCAPPYDPDLLEAVKVPAPRGVYVATLIYRVPPSHVTPHTRTILYSHGNATDLGAMFPLQVVLAHALDCHVVVYDYSGYGESGGVPLEPATYRDLQAVLDYVVDQVADGRPENVVLYGQSVGSGPCCYIASQKDAEVGGMILHSPFTSGMRVLTPSRLLACLDIYPNINRISKVKCPTMIIHGRLDQEVDISHGYELHRGVPSQYKRPPWWVVDRGHNDITEGPGKLAEYIRRLRHFLNSLDDPEE